jgi:hypothetical protein
MGTLACLGVSLFMMPRLVIARAFLVSLGLHGAAFVWVKVRAVAAETHDAPRVDVWSGSGLELDDVPVETSSTQVPAAPEPEVETTVEREPSLAEAPRDEVREPALAVAPECDSDCSPSNARGDRANRKERTPSATSERPPASERRATATATAHAASATAHAASSTPGNAEPASGAAFGSVGLPPGVRYLPVAYTRALSQGGWGVAGFRTVPPGKLCEASLGIAVADDRSIGPVEYPSEHEREALPELCRTLFENARRLIVSGEFSRDPASLASGVTRLRVTVVVTETEPRDGAEDAPHGLWSESHEPVSAGRRGRSSFTLNSGRRVDAFVELG